MLRFWHPVLASDDLHRGKVRAVRIAGLPVAMFRTVEGRVSAIADQCAHRRMRLSEGRVEGDRLICPYHGWSYTAHGEGESPSTPRLHACVDSYDCEEASGAIWIRKRGATETLRPPSVEGMKFTGAVFSTVRAPLELVIDNFSEVEHTVEMHPDFGFGRDGAEEATAVLETCDQSVTVRSHGPAKMPPFDTRLTGGIRRGDRFHSDFTFRFDPPLSTVRHYWVEARSERRRPIEYRLFHFFVPTDASTTTIVTFGFLSVNRALFRILDEPVAWLFRRKLERTVEEDARIVENLADPSPHLEGMKLGRFDAILGLTRDRLARIYYGTAD